MRLLEVDEWAADHPTSMSTGYRMTDAERSEALHLLAGAADLVGHIPPEITAGIKQAILRCDGGSLMWLRLLRHNRRGGLGVSVYEPTGGDVVGVCTSACWTAVQCPACGDDLPPRGRNVPLEAGLSQCCEERRYSDANLRHLWSEAEVADFADLMRRQREREVAP